MVRGQRIARFFSPLQALLRLLGLLMAPRLGGRLQARCIDRLLSIALLAAHASPEGRLVISGRMAAPHRCPAASRAALPRLQPRRCLRLPGSRLVPCAALPLDPVALCACAAAASSLLTVAWVRGAQSRAPAQPEHGSDSPEAEAPDVSAPAEADSVRGVWDAAWAAFDKQQPAPSQRQEQPQQPAGEGRADSTFEDEPVAAKPLLLLQARTNVWPHTTCDTRTAYSSMSYQRAYGGLCTCSR